MNLKRTLAIAVAALTLGGASVALAGAPNPTPSQDPYWNLKDQAAAWREYRLQKTRTTAPKNLQPAPQAAPATKRPAKG
jgi:hypothetical protein